MTKRNNIAVIVCTKIVPRFPIQEYMYVEYAHSQTLLRYFIVKLLPCLFPSLPTRANHMSASGHKDISVNESG